MTSKTFGNDTQKKANVMEAVQKSRTKTIIGMEAVTTLHEKKIKTPRDLNVKQRKEKTTNNNKKNNYRNKQ